ncbi:putative non-specific serine/threonine protein kinase [Helianthus annuus]|nr:putative non-specific serine/threonine protein kinase [Helianthus annuus]KAJ0543333.1 putative non-specific serine/threonine protein kinase [Helianthus annuus]KAJ0708391.1 putative non-specific serine/threonine protein kinase [Helianthus annuus]KAJ0889382.1 putative non-specific serine/threonine protein kinase [Helianthus annuus]
MIYVKDIQTLNVTFTPSPNSYAFINGIEIVSMPGNLYFNRSDLKFVDQTTGYTIDEKMAFESLYRLNMGGGQVPDDTGMYRSSWDQDNNYIDGAVRGKTPVNETLITYTSETPNYTAPEPVYATQRSLGLSKDLAWRLPVDSGFYYMLRLHFCNIMTNITKHQLMNSTPGATKDQTSGKIFNIFFGPRYQPEVLQATQQIIS